ncbi:TPA: phage tail protein [Streptococcus suis]|nr:phage tail protein [Streptococcus suis]
MIYLFDKDEKLIKIIRKSAVKTALQKYALTTERYVSDRLTVELKGLNADELGQVEYMAIQTMEDAHTFHYFYVAQKFSDELTTLIGVQSGIEELRKSPVYDKRPQNALARDVITDLLAGTNWQARFVGETTPHSTNFYYTSIFDALKKVCEVWDLEMQFFVEMNGNRIGARYIDFKQRIGEAVGKRVVYGHNALQILQEVERTNIFTALVGRGKGEETGDGYGRKITFENVVWSRTQGKPVDKPKGQKFLELPLMTRQYGIKNADGSMRPKIGFVDFSEEENPEVLIERTYRALVDAARPQLTLKTSSVYLRGVKVGDTIRVVRHDKKLDYDTRIFEITFNRLNNQSSDTKLGDRIGESNEAKVQTIADKAVEQFVNNGFSNFVQNLPDYLPSADGFNNNWYGTEDPTAKYPGKVLINDVWYKPDPEHEGHKIMLRWTGEVWEEILRTYESEALRDRIAEEIAQVEQSMQSQAQEHDRQVADILSKTQSVEALANQAKSDAASAIARANQVKTEAIADARAQVATVSQALNTAKTELQMAIANADQKARDSQASATALRNDLNSQANKILAQAQAQTALTNRVTTVETLADGTRSTVTELSKTVNKATGDIASVTSRTKTVEDTLRQTRTQYEALTQTVNGYTGQIDGISRRTGTIEAGLTGVTERFELFQSGKNLLLGTDDTTIYTAKLEYVRSVDLAPVFDKYGLTEYTVGFDARVRKSGNVHVYMQNGSKHDGLKSTLEMTTDWQRYYVTFTPYLKNKQSFESLLVFYTGWGSGIIPEIKCVKLEIGSIGTPYSKADIEIFAEIATYKRTAEESSAELQRQIQTVDGKAVDAKNYAQQTAEGFRTRIESLESYKNAEGTRASQYFAASRDETARQVSALRTAVTDGYVAKSTYDENVRGTTLKLNEIKSTADTTKQNLATYQNTVDGKLEELISSTQTLDGKINTASAKITQNAQEISKRLTSTQVESAITSKGYQTKSDVDSNITGRGYITNSALQPYALSTTVQNIVKETADSFSRTISETKALIPTSVGGRNLIKGSAEMVIGSGRWQDGTFRKSGTGTIKTINISSPPVPNVTKGIEIEIASATECGIAQDALFLPKGTYTFTVWVKGPTGATGRIDTFNGSGSNSKVFRLTGGWDKVTVTNTSTVDETKSVSYVYLINSPGYPAKMHLTAPKLETGTIPTDYTLAIEDLATVTALHAVNDTVDSHTRIIGAVGTNGSILDNISKVTQTAAGLVQEVSGTNGLKTQVSTLAGSYAIKNLTSSGKVLNQLNLNKDGSVKIDGSLVQITGKTYIENGVIKEAMIGKGQIGTAHIGEIDAGIAKIINLDVSNIKGLDAEFIKAKIENAFIEWMKGKTITAQNEAMTIGLNDAFIRFKDNAKIEFQSKDNTLYRTKNGTSAFIHFRDDSYNGVYTAMGVNADNTGTQNDYSSGAFAGVRVIRSNPNRYSGRTVDQVQLVGDEIRIRHGYGYENDYLVIKWDNQGKIDLIKFLRSVASRLGLPLT